MGGSDQGGGLIDKGFYMLTFVDENLHDILHNFHVKKLSDSVFPP